MTTNPSGPTALTSRALAPDLARGFMLLFIALANSHYFPQGPSVLGGFPMDGSTLDSAVTWLLATFVDGRAFPMFGLLFGYGVAHITRRQEPSGRRAVRRVLWRRGFALLAIGFLHSMFLYVGDILSAYGVLLLAGAWMVFWKDRWLLLLAGFFFLLGFAPGDGSFTIDPNPPDASMLPTDFLSQFGDRLPAFAFIAFLGPLGFICPFLIGLWAGRRRILEQPERHLKLLWIAATVGIAGAALGAQPVALVLAQWVDKPDKAALELIGPLHDATGVMGGFGYAALISLIALRLGPKPGPVVDAIAALGQRSMTCYLAQSVVWALVFTPYLLDLSTTLTVTTTALLATATWLGTVALAEWMRRTDRRGPFEVLIRRITYRQKPVARVQRPTHTES